MLFGLFNKKHYMHVSYSKGLDNGNVYTNDALVQITGDKGLGWIREELRKDICKKVGYDIDGAPVITSITELSKSLYKTLLQI